LGRNSFSQNLWQAKSRGIPCSGLSQMGEKCTMIKAQKKEQMKGKLENIHLYAIRASGLSKSAVPNLRDHNLILCPVLCYGNTTLQLSIAGK
jgi:thymidylate kinase